MLTLQRERKQDERPTQEERRNVVVLTIYSVVESCPKREMYRKFGIVNLTQTYARVSPLLPMQEAC
jgi:hypothetical protein